ncbi:hypothetical protein NMY22_g6455 [Coprinellus aureogranulatus]|nr:hypothetical protein NMY22_g6455 [Coprinellus aureogranulatus]
MKSSSKRCRGFDMASDDNPEVLSSAPSSTSSAKRARISSLEEAQVIYPFLEGLTLDALWEESESLTEEYERAMVQVVTPKPFSLPQLLQAYDDVTKNPISSSTPGSMRNMVSLVRNHKAHDAVEVVHTRYERYSVMLSSIHMWYWLDVIIKQRIREIFEQTSPSPSRADWLSTAIDIAEFALRFSEPGSILFSPIDRPGLAALLSVPVVISTPGKKRYVKTNQEERALLLGAITHAVQDLLIKALEFPVDARSRDRKRSWVMGVIADVVGIEFLATRYAWNTYASFQIKDFIPDSRLYRSIDPDLVLPFKAALQTHPILVLGSDEHWVYHSFLKELRRHAQHSTPLVPTPHAFIRTFPGLDGFLRKSLQFLQQTLSAADPLSEYLRQKIDSRLPFREKAPSRKRFSGEHGPFAAATIRTDAGLYSAILYRGITYNTPFSRHPDSPMVFSSYNDWRSRIAMFQADHLESIGDAKYFCVRNAYGGQSINNRELGNAQDFWDGVVSLNWSKVASGPSMSFSECLGLVAGANFRSLGPLCNYLLVCDLHYAGICDSPTVADIANAVFSIKGGSYIALTKLGLIPGGDSSRGDIANALLELQAHIQDAFTEEELDAMGWDLICLEHLLCKFCRAVKHGVAEE